MLNEMQVQGRLTKDPEYKILQSQKEVCNFTLAITSGFGDSERVDFLSCTAWGSSANFVSKYIKKGDMLIVGGKFRSDSFEDANGQKQYRNYCLVSEVNSCGARDNNGTRE